MRPIWQYATICVVGETIINYYKFLRLCDRLPAAQLREALLQFPGVLIPLLEKCSITPDEKLTACKYLLAKTRYANYLYTYYSQLSLASLL